MYLKFGEGIWHHFGALFLKPNCQNASILSMEGALLRIVHRNDPIHGHFRENCWQRVTISVVE